MNSIALSLVPKRIPICDLGFGSRAMGISVYTDSEFSGEVECEYRNPVYCGLKAVCTAPS